VPVFYALDDARTPVRISLISVGIKIALNFAFIIPFGFFGLPLATSIASWLNMGLLLRYLRTHSRLPVPTTGTQSYVRIAFASATMGMLSLGVFRFSEAVFPAAVIGQHLRLGLAILAGVASIFPLFRLFRVGEAKEIYRVAGRLLRKFQ
jgi:putative peptidoglycan lipid II flippase